MSESGVRVPVLYSFQDTPMGAVNTYPEAHQGLRSPHRQFDSRPSRVQLKIVPGIELEERICSCGCKRKWKCLPSSKSKYFSMEECAPRSDKPARLEFANPSPRAIGTYVRLNGKPRLFN